MSRSWFLCDALEFVAVFKNFHLPPSIKTSIREIGQIDPALQGWLKFKLDAKMRTEVAGVQILNVLQHIIANLGHSIELLLRPEFRHSERFAQSAALQFRNQGRSGMNREVQPAYHLIRLFKNAPWKSYGNSPRFAT